MLDCQQRLVAVHYHVHRVAQLLNHPGSHFLIHQIVFGHQDSAIRYTSPQDGWRRKKVAGDGRRIAAVRQDVKQRFSADGFRNHSGDGPIPISESHTAVSKIGHQNQLQSGQGTVGTHGLHEVDPVQSRHLAIHQRKIDGLAGRGVLLQNSKGGLPIGALRWMHAPISYLLHQQPACCVVIFHHQNSETFQHLRG